MPIFWSIRPIVVFCVLCITESWLMTYKPGTDEQRNRNTGTQNLGNIKRSLYTFIPKTTKCVFVNLWRRIKQITFFCQFTEFIILQLTETYQLYSFPHRKIKHQKVSNICATCGVNMHTNPNTLNWILYAMYPILYAAAKNTTRTNNAFITLWNVEIARIIDLKIVTVQDVQEADDIWTLTAKLTAMFWNVCSTLFCQNPAA